MILVLWLARLLWRVSVATKRAGDALYNACWTHDLRRKARNERRSAIERVIAESRGRTWDESPFNGETR